MAGLLHRLTAPKILRDTKWIPTFRQTCFPPERAEGCGASSSTNAGGASDVGDGPAATSWQQHLAAAPTSAFANSFSNVLGSKEVPRLVFFGEQHHQPHVIRAQIQLLATFVEKVRAREADHNATGGRPVKHHIHLVMEHFALSDQPLLDRFRMGTLSVTELCRAYRHRSNEGFRMEMYAPLLMFARDEGVHLWGGFPQRSWARTVMREGIAQAAKLEEARAERRQEDPPRRVAARTGEAADGKLSSVGPMESAPELPKLPPGERLQIPTFTAWDNVSTLTASHRAFLASLMKPDQPPRFTELGNREQFATCLPPYAAGSASDANAEPIRYPTEQIARPPPQLRGFAPAQALKDAYLAHAAGSLLHEGHRLASTPSQRLVRCGDGSSDGEDGALVEHRNYVLVVAGLGHVQGGFGGPERVAAWLRDQSRSSSDTPESIIVLSMPNDSSLWLGPEWAAAPSPHPAPPPAHKDARGATTSIASEVAETIPEGWGRKVADAIVLYDWVDFETEVRAQPVASSEEGPISVPQ
ncbi:unnamed protein product [Parajaminaea phylloscopi]